MQRYIIDRIENGLAVCEDENRVMRDIPLALLPPGAKPGGALIFENGAYRLDAEEAERRRRRILELEAKLFHD